MPHRLRELSAVKTKKGKMKRISIYVLAVMTLGAGCRKTYNDTVQGQTADQRIAAAMAAYQKKLTGAPYGWIFLESTTGEAFNQGVSQAGPKIILAYYMKFTDSNQVTMLSDFDPSMAATPAVSSYRVKALTRPALIFDTYSYLHTPCDPDPNISHSPYGYGFGWGTDFEYSFADSVAAGSIGDTIHLTGNLNSAKGMLIKATQAQQTAYLNGNVQTLMVGVNNTNNILEYFKRLSLGGVSYEIRIDAVNRTVTFSWVDGSGNVQTSTVSYYIGSTGIVFSSPIVNGSQKITGIDNVNWDGGTSTLTVTIGGQQGTVTGAIAPLKTDLGAPARWWNYAYNNNAYWASSNGFHQNGVDDAFGITTLSNALGNFYFYVYWPAYYSNPADRFIPIMFNGTALAFNSYGTAPKAPPTFTADGRAVFVILGNTGAIPAGGAVAKSNTALYSSAGYYFIQTGEKSYDMVGASDARTWITWFYPL
jgi:hypothetical protein